MIELEVRQEGLHAKEVPRGRERRGHHPAAHPLVVDQLAIVVLRKSDVGAGEVAEVIDGTGHRRASALANEREALAALVRIPDQRRLRWRENLRTSVLG